jgi:Protein of unknown function (DUF3617)
MTRQLVSLCLGCCLLALLPASGARADELPLRKPGLWEMKMVKTGSIVPSMTIEHCTDETTDKEMVTMVAPVSKEACSKREVQKTATGYVSDSVCTASGVSMTTHSDITGDFNSAYTVKFTSHTEGAVGQHEVASSIEAKWLGACKPDQKPGDVVMPGGLKMNIRDIDKLKGLLPK